MDDPMTRRRVLGAVGGATAGAVAGCSGDGADDQVRNDEVTEGGTEQTDGDTATATAERSDRTGAFTATNEQNWPSYRATPQNNPVLTAASVPRSEPTVAWELLGHYSDPAIVSGTAYVPRFDEMAAVDVATGEVQWTYTRETRVSMTPTVIGETVYTVDGGGITAIDRANGERLWTDDAVTPGTLGPQGERLVGASVDHAFAYDPAAREVEWTTPLPGENPDWNEVLLTASDGRRLYVLAVAGVLAAFDTESGAVDWQRSLGSNSLTSDVGLNVAGENVYLHHVPDTSPTIRAIAKMNGEDNWTKPAGAGGVTPVLTSKGAYFHDYYGGGTPSTLARYDGVTGQLDAEFSAVDGAHGWQPAIAGDVMVYWADRKTIAAHDLAADEELWRFEHGYEANDSLVVTDDAVLFREGASVKCLRAP